MHECFSLFLYSFGLEKCFSIRKLYQETGAYVDTQNWHDSCFLDDLDRPVRPLVQTGQEKFVKSSIGLHHCVDLVEMIEMHIWNVQFGVQMRELYPPEDLHPVLAGQTGPGRSDRSRDR